MNMDDENKGRLHRASLFVLLMIIENIIQKNSNLLSTTALI